MMRETPRFYPDMRGQYVFAGAAATVALSMIMARSIWQPVSRSVAAMTTPRYGHSRNSRQRLGMKHELESAAGSSSRPTASGIDGIPEFLLQNLSSIASRVED
jgi:hypothetical protein